MQFRKPILFLSLISLMFLSSSAFALQSGDFTYTVSNNTVTITGYTCPGGAAVIPPSINNMPVVSIGEFAFRNCASLTSVTIPDSVTSIGTQAFEYCGLTSVTIPSSVTSIEGGVFEFCSNLTSVTIPNSITSIGDYAFAYCGLTSVTIPSSVTSIGDGAFYYCSGLTSVTIPNSVTSIGGGAFFFCTGLTSVTIPSSVTSIGESAFYNCSGLTKAYFSGNAPSMGASVFVGCASNFTVCYTAGSTGFTTPTWDDYPASVCAETTSSTTTVILTTTTTISSTTTTIQPNTTTTIPANHCAAEAIYGRDSEETVLLREYRDKVLSKSVAGRQMIKTYYELSPAVAEVLQKNDEARASARRVLDSIMPAIREKVKQ